MPALGLGCVVNRVVLTVRRSLPVTAKKRGHKVIVDLNSIDAYYESLPDVSKTAKGEG